MTVIEAMDEKALAQHLATTLGCRDALVLKLNEARGQIETLSREINRAESYIAEARGQLRTFLSAR